MSGLGRASRKAIKGVLRRFPAGLKLADGVLDGAVRLILAPQVDIPPAAKTHDPKDLAARTDSLNEAAEGYFSDYPYQEFILNKPYSDPLGFPQHLFNLGVLFHWLRLSPGDVVAELGAGTAWVSHFLNLYGCRTIAIDVSSTALDLAKELFERDRRTRWDLEPRFLPYDGRRFPLEDASCDRIVVHDAFHHIPNQHEILSEMARVLRPGGVVAMVEPGRQHSLTADSRKEMEETGVLENDIVVEDLAEVARESGFTKTTVVPVSLAATMEVPARDLTSFLKGKGFRPYWSKLSSNLLAGHYILMYKGDYRPTTRRPERLEAKIEILEPQLGAKGLTGKVGEETRVRCRISNRGDTVWLGESAGRPGCTRIGGHLYRGDEPKALDYDWYRGLFEEAIEPGEVIDRELVFPAILEPGPYRVVLDMVAEGVLWFAQKGSPTLEFHFEVSSNS
ncbi:MAG: methyltransferase domain-containing protein [Deltaproteobacteria bacterium]|nr:methyltransferase domain-containing protein [Deltaproteobacteria bacterium]